MPTVNASIELYKALMLPRGYVQKVSPKLVHKEKVYAHDLTFQLSSGQRIVVDVRQLPTEAIPQAVQYSEIGIYITSFAELSKMPLAPGNLTCRCLGPQMSLVFLGVTGPILSVTSSR